jgi:hypothetical protein
LNHPSRESREEDSEAVAKKTAKRPATKKAVSKPSKKPARPAAKAAKKPAAKPKAAPAPKRAAATTALHAGLPLGDRARQVHEEITRSKLTHPDPWRYAPKARDWGERAQVIVELIAVPSETASALSSLEALVAELESDRDFQEARRLF